MLAKENLELAMQSKAKSNIEKELIEELEEEENSNPLKKETEALE